MIINDGRHSERLRGDANYENALEEAEKEQKEINYGNYLACLPSRTPFRASSSFGDVCVSGLWFDLFKFFLRYFLFFLFGFLFSGGLPPQVAAEAGRTLGYYYY